MRIWSEDLIPYLCRQHLLGMWREIWCIYNVIDKNKKGYRQHPATIEFENAPQSLVCRMRILREEMLKRGYKPKELPFIPSYAMAKSEPVKEWETLKEQIVKLKSKKCNCKIWTTPSKN